MKLNEANTHCSVARAIDKIGDSWSLLIIRDLGRGLTNFDEFQKSLSIAPGVLSKRLLTLTQQGLVRKELYQDNPPRAKYVLTQAGEEFLPILCAIMAWGNKHSSPNGVDTELVDRETHKRVTPIVVDSKTMEPIVYAKLKMAGGHAAAAKKVEALKADNLPLTPVD